MREAELAAEARRRGSRGLGFAFVGRVWIRNLGLVREEWDRDGLILLVYGLYITRLRIRCHY